MTKVLVVDDSRFVYEEVARHLKDTDFEVVGHCREAEEALDAYAQHQPDLVLMDIVLPGMDGFAGAALLLAHHPSLRVVMVSSLAFDDTVASARKVGARGIVFKPINREKLLEEMENAMK